MLIMMITMELKRNYKGASHLRRAISGPPNRPTGTATLPVYYFNLGPTNLQVRDLIGTGVDQ